MTVSPSDMLVFAAVIREGGFSAAAKALGVTKQSVSDRVARLEEALGVRLIERTTRRLRLTDAGAGYYERCEAIAASIDEANREVAAGQAEPTGTLRISAPVLYGRRFLTPVIATCLQRFPQVRVAVALADRRVNLIEEGVDVAIRVGELDDSGLAARKIGEGYVYLVASPGYADELGPGFSPRRARCIGTRPRETWELGGVVHRIDPLLMVNDLEMACDAAVAGLGLALLPSLVCGPAVRDGRLKIVCPAEPASARPVYAVFPSRHLPAKVRVFMELLDELVEPMAPLSGAVPPGVPV